MTAPDTPTTVIATVTGAELLGRLDNVSTAVAGLAATMADVPRTLHDHESRLRVQESARYVTWPQLGAVLAVLVPILGLAVRFLAVKGG